MKTKQLNMIKPTGGIAELDRLYPRCTVESPLLQAEGWLVGKSHMAERLVLTCTDAKRQKWALMHLPLSMPVRIYQQAVQHG